MFYYFCKELIHLSNHSTPLRHRATPPPCRASAPVQLQGGQLAEQQRRRGGGVHEQETGPQEAPLRVHLPSGSPVGSSPDASFGDVRFGPGVARGRAGVDQSTIYSTVERFVVFQELIPSTYLKTDPY